MFSLYKDLKNEKDKEIKDLILKKKENEEKLGKMNNEIKELKEEIKNLKEQNKKDKKEIEIDYEKKINESKNINRNRLRNIDSKLDELEQKVEKNTSKLIDLKLLMDKIEENYSFLQNQIIFLTFNNFENFKTIFEEYYNKLPRRYSGFSNLFDDKPSYNNIVEIIFENIKRNKEGNNKKIIEHSENKKYERYDASEWNWFLINNVIYQMFFCDIKLNEEGVEEALKNIYKINQDFEKKYKSKLESAKYDIKAYVKDYELGKLIGAIKNFKIPKMDLIPEEIKKNLLNYKE